MVSLSKEEGDIAAAALPADIRCGCVVDAVFSGLLPVVLSGQSQNDFDAVANTA